MQAFDLHGCFAFKPQALEELLKAPGAVARQDLHQVTGLPLRGSLRREAKQIDCRALATRVHQLATDQRPVSELGCLPGGGRRTAGQLCQLLLPVLQGLWIGAVDFNRGERRRRPALA
ncbi:hypothetical protein D3C75_1123030 [compost metagenome]